MTKKDKNDPNKTFQDKLAENGIANSIAIVAGIIAILSWVSSCESNKISHEAVKIAKTAELPYFKLSRDLKNGQDKILVYNEGGKLRELEEPQVYYFWSIRSDKAPQDAKELVVVNHYNLRARDPLLSGKTLVTISAADPSKAENLENGFKKLAKANNYLAFISAEWYVRLQYKDIYDELHNDVYNVTYGGSRKMSKSEDVELINRYNQKTTQGMTIDMRTVTPEILYEKWKK